MLTPYDWQEAIGNRASFIEGRLIAGAPVLALSIPEGIVIFSYRRNTDKIFEIYDHLAFSAIGQQSDIESLRLAALDFAHQEGFARSERDVTIRRVVAALSHPIKRAFADFSSAPFVIRALFAEVGATASDDSYAVLDYEGDFKAHKHFAFLVGTDEHVATLKEALQVLHQQKLKASQATEQLRELFDQTFIIERPEGFEPEAVLLERERGRFQRLAPQN